QLATKEKLFCHCPAGIFQKPDEYDAELLRHMRPTLSEMGGYDGTALMEFKTRKNIVYRISHKTACTYDVDDTPPFPLNREALQYALEIALASKLNIVGEVHVTRKQYLDGSIPTGFQRTAILGVEGEIPLKNKKVRLIQLSVEEDACREVSDIGHTRIYRTDRLGMPLLGVKRSTGQHPGGIIVLPLGEDINQFTPVQHPADDTDTSIITTQFDYHSIEHNLLKLDILGKDDPTVIRMLKDLLGVDPVDFPLDSPEALSLFKSTEALGIKPEDIHGCPLGILGIPEFGTDNAISMLLEANPQDLSDLIRVSGLAHGTDVWHGNAEKLIQEGTATLRTAVCTRDDIMQYLISMGMENAEAFNIMESVRKGKVAKKDCPKWPQWKADMEAHGVPDWYIWSCEHIMYMFPKAHAAAYVIMAMRIAYAKVFYPLAYYATYFSIKASGFDYETMCMGHARMEAELNRLKEIPFPKVKEKARYRDIRIVEEMYARGFSFVPIDLYKAQADRFVIVNDKQLMPSFSSIEGMGPNVAQALQEAAKQGPYTSVQNLRNRAKVSQTLLDKMESYGILSGLPKDDQISFSDLF
ncbi:MAG: hypothetical protein IKG97_02365, partial [Lachnospiraceae bacterium]|nr:hypothetical protein [Lachnospiraceae bacterium]